MNRSNKPKRLNLRRETVLLLTHTELQRVVGGDHAAVITKPPVSCAIPCPSVTTCTTANTCELVTFNC